MTDDFFTVVNSLLENKDYCFDEHKDTYNIRGVNQALSQHIDAILMANEVNMCPRITPRQHYDFLFGTIRRMKRYHRKWAKKQEVPNLDAIMDYFTVNRERAEEIAELLLPEHMEELK